MTRVDICVFVFVMACAPEPRVRFSSNGARDPEPPIAETHWQPPTRPLPPTCGATFLERVALLASGKGEKHPDVLALDAVLSHCTDTSPSADDCLAVVRERAELEARGYGLRHPSMMANDAKRAACPPPK